MNPTHRFEHEQTAATVLTRLRDAGAVLTLAELRSYEGLSWSQTREALHNLRIAGLIQGGTSRGWVAKEYASLLLPTAEESRVARGLLTRTALRRARRAGAQNAFAYAHTILWHARVDARRRLVTKVYQALTAAAAQMEHLQALRIESELRREMLGLVLRSESYANLDYTQAVAAFESKFCGVRTPSNGISRDTYHQRVCRGVRRVIALGASSALCERLARQASHRLPTAR